MKITATQKIGIPILSLILAFGILAFQHHENQNESGNTDSEKSSSVIPSTSMQQKTFIKNSDNDSSSE